MPRAETARAMYIVTEAVEVYFQTKGKEKGGKGKLG